jgi:hypothetical protein
MLPTLLGCCKTNGWAGNRGSDGKSKFPYDAGSDRRLSYEASVRFTGSTSDDFPVTYAVATPCRPARVAVDVRTT